MVDGGVANQNNNQIKTFLVCCFVIANVRQHMDVNNCVGGGNCDIGVAHSKHENKKIIIVKNFRGKGPCILFVYFD